MINAYIVTFVTNSNVKLLVIFQQSILVFSVSSYKLSCKYYVSPRY